jgi:SAM-dependent methyltransferase
MGSQRWNDIWDRRALDRDAPSRLAALMAADGLDTGFGDVTEAAWRDFVGRMADRLGLGDGASAYEVGCGAGAFLLPLAERGVRVGGLDASAALLGYAREALPAGTPLDHDDAATLREHPRCDVALACGVFLYFPDEAYAREVLARMVRKARRAVAVLDVADRATQDAALAHRRAHLGPEAYAVRYEGLDHLYLDRAWFERELLALGCVSVVTEDQHIAGYANGRYRFNVLATLA